MALRALRYLGGHGPYAPLGHSNTLGMCPIETSTMELACPTSRLCSVHGPHIHGDTRDPRGSTHAYPSSVSSNMMVAHLAPRVLGMVESLTPCLPLKSILSF